MKMPADKAFPLGPYTPNEHGVYWNAPNDGARIRCSECGGSGNPAFERFIITEIPGGIRDVYHYDCVFPNWREKALFLGNWPS